MEQEHINPVYKKGFEHGYWLQRGGRLDQTGTADTGQKETDYSRGFLAGSREAAREQFKNQLNDTRNGQSKERDREGGISRD